MRKTIGLLFILVLFAGFTIIPAYGSEREEFFSMDGRKFWSLGANIGTAFATPLLIANINFTIAPLPNSFFEFGVDWGFINGKAGENVQIGDMNYSSNYLYARANLFFPIGKRDFDSYGKPREGGGIFFGLGIGLNNAEYAYNQGDNGKLVGTVQTPTFDTTAGGLIGKGHILFRVAYAIRSTMDVNNPPIGLNHRLMLGIVYRIY